MRAVSLCAASALALALTSPVLAQQPSAGNLEKLGEFKTTGTPEMAHIPQTGPKAEAIKKNLARIKLPRGFKIGLYALVPDARHIAVGPQGARARAPGSARWPPGELSGHPGMLC